MGAHLTLAQKKNSKPKRKIKTMSRCTAPVYGHRSAAAAANGPACGGRGGYLSSYGSYDSYSPPSYSSYSGGGSSGGGGSSSSGGKRRASWSNPGSTTLYTNAQISALEPVRKEVEKLTMRDASIG